ncbi:MAG: aminotransferase class IV [Planctomycetota bacterium]|jgi:D-alanine transaminase
MQIAMIQDKIVPISEIEPVYLDRGIFFGDGVYEVLRSYDGKIFALEEHLQRFANSLSAIAISSVDINQIRRRVLKSFDAAGISNAKIYFHITRGSELRKHLSKADLEPIFFMTVTELEDDTQTKTNGIEVSTHPDWRWKRCDIKSLNLLANVLARRDAALKGSNEAILVDETGLITEGASSAFFIIFKEKLQTTPLTANILPSITRQFVLKAAKNIGLETIEKSVTPRTQDITPVVKFDSKLIGDSRPGKYTKLLTREYLSFTA